MKWLLTVPAGTDRAALAGALAGIGCTLLDLDPVPLGEAEQALYAEGPRDLPALLAGLGLPVRASPSSEYGYT